MAEEQRWHGLRRSGAEQRVRSEIEERAAVWRASFGPGDSPRLEAGKRLERHVVLERRGPALPEKAARDVMFVLFLDLVTQLHQVVHHAKQVVDFFDHCFSQRIAAEVEHEEAERLAGFQHALRLGFVA